MTGNEIESTPYGLVAMLVASMFVITALTPRRQRLHVALVMMCVLMTLGRLRDFGEVAFAAKLATFFSLLQVAITAALHPGPRRRINAYNAAAIGCALIGCVVVTGAEDWGKAFVFRAQALLAAVATLLMARIAVDQRAMRSLLASVFFGVSLGTLLTLSCLIVDPVGAFASGYGRMSPYGCNPVQIGVLFFVTATLGLYFTTERHERLGNAIPFYMTLLACGGAALTVSRMAVLGIALASIPCVVRLSRKPLLAIIFIVGTLALGGVLYGKFQGSNLDHLEASRDSRRLEFMREAFDEVSQRPLFGMLYAEGAYAHDGTINAHSAYIETLYLGGAAYAVPSFLLLMVATWGSWRSLRSHHSAADRSRLLNRCLVAMYWVMLANGFVTYINNYPIFCIAILQAFLTQHFLIEAGAPARRSTRSAVVAPRARLPRAGSIPAGASLARPKSRLAAVRSRSR